MTGKSRSDSAVAANTSSSSNRKRNFDETQGKAKADDDDGNAANVTNAKEQSSRIAIQVDEHTKATKALLSSIDDMVEAFCGISTSSSQSTDKAMPTEPFEQAVVHFMRLKSTQRDATLMVEQKSRMVQKEKAETEAGHLILQNFAYEKNHLLREISSCRDYVTPHLTQMAQDELLGSDISKSNVDDSNNELITKFVGHDITLPKDRGEHQKILGFITNQIEERTSLKGKLEEVKDERQKVEKESESKRKFLSNLPEQLNVLEKATLPLQQYLGLKSSQKRERYARASKLSKPLYILCCQLEAYANAFDVNGQTMSVDVVNARSPEEDSTTNTKILPEPLCVVLYLYSSSSIPGSHDKTDKIKGVVGHLGATDNKKEDRAVTTEIRFLYWSTLNIITAEAVGHPNLLLSLFQGDDGATTPNLSSFHQNQTQNAAENDAPDGHEDTSMIIDGDDNVEAEPHTSVIVQSRGMLPKNYNGRPYMWAQWLGGLCFLNDTNSGNAEDTAPQRRLEPSTRAVLRQLQRRVRAQHTMQYLLKTLSAAAAASSSSSAPSFVPVHEAMKEMFPSASHTGSEAASLVGWTEVVQKVDQIKPYFGHKPIEKCSTAEETSSLSDMGCRYFRARLMHKGIALNAFVEVSPEYPAKAPRWLLQATSPLWEYQDESLAEAANSGKIVEFDNQMQDVEVAVNAEYAEDLILPEEETTLDWILVHQLRKIMTCWAAISDGPDHGSISGVRVRRGRNRRKALAFERYGRGRAC